MSNFARCTFFSIVRLLPTCLMMRSSFGRLKAAVVTALLASPAASSWLTTRIGAAAPSFGLRSFASIGRLFSISCSSPASLASFAVSASSRTQMNASNAAFAPNQPSSYVS